MIEVKVPELSESVNSGTLLTWRKAVGDAVVRDEILVDLETDKVVLEISTPAAGVLSEILASEGSEVQVGQVIARLGDVGEGVQKSPVTQLSPPPIPQPAVENKTVPERSTLANANPKATKPTTPPQGQGPGAGFLRPSQRRQMETAAPSQVSPVAMNPSVMPATAVPVCGPARNERRVPMTRLRLRIAERLKEAQNTAAMLTTFNEVNMQPVQQLRQRYKDSFQQGHGVKLGLMSFFVKAICHALKQYPVINARVDGRDILYHDYCDIGVAVSSERGLVVPVLRDAEILSLADIERRIGDFSRRANALQLQIEELEGGTFTVTNGGVFGSLMSTPILNPPQSAVLGLHKIQDRPVAENGQVVIRPMMYLALSYDHRIIDGREAVSFLASVKEGIEDPARLLLDL